MPFRIDPARPVQKNVRRLARHELDRALSALADPGELGLEETVHDVRKRCKKLRALIRLAQPGLGREYARANLEVRDAARELSSLRDARALLGTFDALVAATHANHLPGESLEQVRTGLVLRAREAEGADAAILLGRASGLLQGVRDRLARWSLDDDVSILLDGLAENHRRGRRAFRRCRGELTDEALHEWRKRAKYEWHHVQLLQPIAPSALGPQEERLKALSDGLGDDHDLAVLRATILAAPSRFGADDAAIGLIEAVRSDLQDRCLRLGARIYAESPRAFGRRVGRYWTAWHVLGRERPVGTLGDLAAEPADRPPRADDLIPADASA